MSYITYDTTKKTVTQCLGVISNYSLEGVFQEVLANLQKELKEYEKYLTTPQKVEEGRAYWNQTGNYLDKSICKEIIFTSIHLNWHTSYDESERYQELRVIGHRPMDESELEALQNQLDKSKLEQEKQEKETLKKLQEKYKDIRE